MVGCPSQVLRLHIMNAIQLEHVTKAYKLYHHPGDRLKEAALRLNPGIPETAIDLALTTLTSLPLTTIGRQCGTDSAEPT